MRAGNATAATHNLSAQMNVRRIALVLFLAALPAVAQTVQGGPDDRQLTDPKTITSAANPAARPVPINDLYYTRHTGGGAWSPDGNSVVFTTDLGGRLNLWKVSVAGGWPIQLSQADDPQESAAWSPDGQWIVYQQDHQGNELADLYAVPAAGGTAINLTNTAEISETSPYWSPDGKLIAVGYKPKTAPVTDIAIFDWQTRRVRNLTQEKTPDHIWNFGAWGPDDSVIYATRTNAGFTDSDIYRVNVSSGAAENLTPHQGQVLYTVSSVSPDGRTLLIGSNEKGGYNNVALLDIATKKLTWATETKWEATPGDFSRDGRSFTYVINEDGRIDAFLADTATRQGQKLAVPQGLNIYESSPTAFSPNGRALLLSHQSAREPADLWIYDIAARRPRQLTLSTMASVNPQSIPASQIVHYKSFDGKIISAFLWMPFNLKRDGTNPAIVIPHGGPTGQVDDSFNRTAAALATRGYICLAPNVRGSTGYGIAFQKANYQDLGGGDLQDEVYGVRLLTGTGYVDAKKVGITGGSYGGFMTLMAIGKTPDLWAAAVELYGIIDWYTMLQHSDPFLQQYERSLLGDPQRDRAAYENASPIKYIRNERAPLLVLQGDHDIRVPKEEAEQVVAILKQQGKVVDVHYYPDEGHGFSRRENQIDAIERTVAWFDRYLKSQPPPGNQR